MTKKALAESAAYFKSFFEYNRGQARGAVVVLEFIGSDRVVEVPRSGGEYFLNFNSTASVREVSRTANHKERKTMSTSSPATTQRLLSTCRPISENETVAAFETTVDGFVAVLDRVKLDGALNELAERLLPQGGELSSRLHDGGFCILEAHGLGRLAAIERATLAEVVVDEALSAHSRGGAR